MLGSFAGCGMNSPSAESLDVLLRHGWSSDEVQAAPRCNFPALVTQEGFTRGQQGSLTPSCLLRGAAHGQSRPSGCPCTQINPTECKIPGGRLRIIP